MILKPSESRGEIVKFRFLGPSPQSFLLPGSGVEPDPAQVILVVLFQRLHFDLMQVVHGFFG